MDFLIKITCDNAAFEDCTGDELARILRKLADDLDGGNVSPGFSCPLSDTNGNRCGGATMREES